jgi:hypothetical protein
MKIHKMKIKWKEYVLEKNIRNKTLKNCKNQMSKDLPGCLYEGNKCETPKVFLLKHGDETTK